MTTDEARRPAPAGLRLVQEFCNSADFEDGWDELADPAGLTAWLAGHGHCPDAPLTSSDVERAVDFREALRDALTVAVSPGLARTHPDPALAEHGPELAARRRARGRAALTVAGRALPVRVVFGDTAHLEPAATGLPGALGAMLAALAIAEGDGTAARLKVCEADSCRWVFYDQSRNGSSRWCTMRLCGARSKNRAYRRRRAGGPV
ncbi:CGNR zinc finger domain-containing protein [Longispora sp. K20-0274]|uniref:CGNR zinc finger domain-containing protein n=1 Tax=Longispora sp. K20-0274 TaxID=3088255 RepID=UPI00399B3768